MIALVEESYTGFNPSSALRLAQHEMRRPTREAASNRPMVDLFDLVRFVMTSFSVRTLAPTVEIGAGRNASIGRRLADVPVRVAKPTRVLVGELREMGMPISGIAEIVGVQRKTVYSWINEEVVAEPRNHDRLQAVYDLLSQELPGSLQFLTRHWERQLPEEGGTLKSILAAESLNLERAREALEWLRPAILRSVKQSRHHSGVERTASPASSLTEYLEAVTK